MIVAAYIGRSFVSRAIQVWSRAGLNGPSHIAIDDERGNIYEAWHTSGDGFNSGVRVVPHYGAGHTPGTLVRRYLWPMTYKQEAAALEFLQGQLGKGYDFRGCLGFPLLRRRDVCPERWFCSELAVACGLFAGAPLLNCLPHLATPDHVCWSPVLRSIGFVVTTRTGYVPAMG